MTEQPSRLRASELENSGDLGNNPTPNLTMGEVIAARFNRRDLLKGSLAVTAISATLGSARSRRPTNQPAEGHAPSFAFKEIEAGVDQTHHVAEGYDAQILLRWGDPALPGRAGLRPPRPDRRKAGAASSATTPTSSASSRIDGSSDHGLLVANHEYTNEELMFPGVGIQDAKDANFAKMTKELVDIEMVAHGGAVVEIRREHGRPLAGRQGLALQPPHHGRHADGDHRPGGRPRADEDLRRPDGPHASAAWSTTAPAA